ncbi:MVD Diphosphomevalonate decarboxylase [Candida maltosa Xu316]|uniref:Diphosphomevalonate decarboxylase n=1 Tax=Candida maltosa (strain Xu316) TaxID=1245528 RepID=M3JUG1_CANMX|nr:Diphosphomevalonate decarboxylase [Candida maltosa Xu316]
MYSASVTAPVNIATLKYWGKRDKTLNLPTNSSISVTLAQDDLRTLTTAAASESFEKDQLWLNGKLESLDTPRTQACLADLRKLREQVEQDENVPKLSKMKLHIVSENNFPTAAGLASSAAGFAALITAIAKLYELPEDMSELSKIARKGSGSACRSLFGGFVAWEMGELVNGEDSKAVEIASLEHWPTMKAVILVVSDDKKDTPSTTGMQSTVQTSDLFAHRITEVVPARFIEMKKAIIDKDFPKFAELTMKDSNSFHAVCLDSYPPIFYLNDTSKRIIKLVEGINKEEAIAAYTFDAGPNAVIYYDESNEDKVLGELYKHFGHVQGWKNSYKSETPINGVSRIIQTSIGPGPQVTKESLINEKGLPN